MLSALSSNKNSQLKEFIFAYTHYTPTHNSHNDICTRCTQSPKNQNEKIYMVNSFCWALSVERLSQTQINSIKLCVQKPWKHNIQHSFGTSFLFEQMLQQSSDEWRFLFIYLFIYLSVLYTYIGDVCVASTSILMIFFLRFFHSLTSYLWVC